MEPPSMLAGPSTPPKQASDAASIAKDTPWVKKVDSLHSRKGTLAQQSSEIRTQSERGPYLSSIDKLPQLCFQDLDDTHVKGCLEFLERSGLVKINGEEYDYPHISSASREKAMYGPVCELFNRIGGYLEAATSGKSTDEGTFTPQYTWIDTHSSANFSAPNLKRYPDVSMVRNLQQLREGSSNMGDVLVPTEIKLRSQSGGVVDQMVDQYRSLASVQINRCFAYGVSLRYPNFQLWRLDRGGVLSSSAINMKKKPEGVIHIIGGLMLSSYGDLGYYGSTLVSGESPGGPWVRFQTTNAFAEPGSPLPTEVETAGDNGPEMVSAESTLDPGDQPVEMRLEIKEVIKEPHGWIGRCTYVGKVKSDNGREYALKASWQDKTRISEGRYYLMARKAGITTGLAEIAGYQELPPLSSFRAGLGDSQFEDRIQCRLLLATIGQPLEKATSIRQLLEAVRDAVICHRDLVLKAGLLHRDVSYNNVQLNDITKHPSVGNGFLIDLEYAKNIARTTTTHSTITRHGRTGTLAFMAAAILQESPPLHQVHHDLESFLWVVLYVCSDGPIWDTVETLLRSTPTYVLNKIFRQTDPYDSRIHKKNLMRKDEEDTDALVVSERFEPLVPYLDELRDLFVTGHPKWPQLNPNIPPPTHEDFLSIISSALEDPKVQDAPPFGPGDYPTPVHVPTMAKQLKRTTSKTSSSYLSPKITGHSILSNSSGRSEKRRLTAPKEDTPEVPEPKRRRTQEE